MSKTNPGDGSWGALWREALVAISLGWDLAVPIFGGVLVGHFLDRWLGTEPTFTLGLLCLGIALGYYNIARFIQRMNRQDHIEAKRNAADKQQDSQP